MPIMGLAVGAAAKGVQKGVQMLRGKRKSGGDKPKKRRSRRIVFSENQWQFVRSLVTAINGARLPSGGGGRRRRRRRPF